MSTSATATSTATNPRKASLSAGLSPLSSGAPFGMRTARPNSRESRAASTRRDTFGLSEPSLQSVPEASAEATIMAEAALAEAGEGFLGVAEVLAGSASAVWGEGEALDDSVKGWWRYAQSFPLLSAEQEVELAKRIEAGDEEAFAQMVNSNLRLVANIARKCRRFAGNSLQPCDLIQEGSIGLMRAVRKFDHRKGYKFSTYACYWIRQAVMRSIAERGRSVRLPVHMVEAVSRAERARVLLTQELERVPTARELATYLQIPEHKVGEILERGGEPMSLDAGIGDADESVLSDFIQDERACCPESNASRGALQGEVRLALDSLNEREAQVIALRFGLDGSNIPRTLDEVGAAMQLTRERIRQIEKSAMKRLRACASLQETAQCWSRGSSSGHTTALA